MNIYVDADACPVKDIIIEEAKKSEISVILVTSYAHFSQREDTDKVRTVYVDTGHDAADYRIMQMAEAGDLIVTQDYGLASLALAKPCVVLHHAGYQYTEENIGRLLETRYLNAKLRQSGKRTKGPKPFSEQDRERFRQQLRQWIH